MSKDIVQDNKDKVEADKKANKQDKTVKVSTLRAIAVTIIVIAVSFGAGWKSNDVHDAQYTSEINKAITLHDAQLKQ
jgi:hypothetical protein